MPTEASGIGSSASKIGKDNTWSSQGGNSMGTRDTRERAGRKVERARRDVRLRTKKDESGVEKKKSSLGGVKTPKESERGGGSKTKLFHVCAESRCGDVYRETSTRKTRLLCRFLHMGGGEDSKEQEKKKGTARPGRRIKKRFPQVRRADIKLEGSEIINRTSMDSPGENKIGNSKGGMRLSARKLRQR